MSFREEQILQPDRLPERRLAVYGISANPPCRHHYEIAQSVLEVFGNILIVPSGNKRRDKPALAKILSKHRVEMTLLNFSDWLSFADYNRNCCLSGRYWDWSPGQSGIGFNFTDIFSISPNRPTYILDGDFKRKYYGESLFHVIGTDLVVGGKDGRSQIQKSWYKGEQVWEELQFIVVPRAGFDICGDDLPPKALFLPIEYSSASSSTEVRKRIASGKSTAKLLMPKVRKYIKEKNLYAERL